MAKKDEIAKAEAVSIQPVEQIEGLILTIRGKQVILDRELARLYGVETKVLNQAVKRNIERFPEDFLFQLTKEEYEILKSQIVTSSEELLRSQIVTIENEEDFLRSQVLRQPRYRPIHDVKLVRWAQQRKKVIPSLTDVK